MTILGKAIRLARLQNPGSGRIFTVAVDHAPSYGVLPGIEGICSVVDRVATASPDAMAMLQVPQGAVTVDGDLTDWDEVPCTYWDASRWRTAGRVEKGTGPRDLWDVQPSAGVIVVA